MPISRIGTDAIEAGAVAPSDLSTGAPSWDGSGNLSFNSGYGSAAVAYGCRAWVNFNGTSTVAIRASGNVSSITDNGTGDYSVNFTTALPDGNYSVQAFTCTEGGETDSREACLNLNRAFNTTTCGVQTTYVSSTKQDRTQVHVAIFR